MADPARALKLLAESIADAIWQQILADDLPESDSHPPAAGDEESLQQVGITGGSNGTHKT